MHNTCQVHTLIGTSPDLEKTLASIQKLTRQVFEPEIPEAQYETSPLTSPQLQLDLEAKVEGRRRSATVRHSRVRV